jgi:hypothetical protein
MKILIRVLIALPALLFVYTGLRWAIDPAGAADGLGMTLLEGIGLSSQIGDVGALFLSMGTMMLVGLITANRTWLLAPALMLSLIAVFRVLAWAVHGADLALDMIIVEVIVTGLLLFASSRLVHQK